MSTTPFCSHCRTPATAFSLTSKKKQPSCALHLSTLLESGAVLYPIAALDFIDSPDDFPLFEARQDETKRIRAYLQILSASAIEEEKIALETIERAKESVVQTVSAAFLEASELLRERHSEVQSQFEALNAALTAYQSRKNAVLPEAARLLSKANSVQLPSFLSLSISESLMTLATEVTKNIKITAEPLERVFQVFDRKRPLWNLVSPMHKMTVRFRPTTDAEVMKMCKQVGMNEESSLVKLPTTTAQGSSSDRDSVVYRFKRVWTLEEVMKLGRKIFDQARDNMWNEEFEDAKKGTEKALSIFLARAPRGREAAMCFLQLGRVLHLGLMQLDEGQQMYQRAFLLCKDCFPTSDLMVDCHASLAGAYASKRLSSESEIHLATALSLALQHCPNSLELAKVYRVYGYLKRELGDYKSALMCDEKAMEISMEADSRSWDVLMSYISVGCDYRDMGEFGEAEQAFLAAAAFSPACGYCLRALLHLAKMHIKKQQLEDAEAVLKRAADMGKQKFPRAKSTAQVIEELSKLNNCAKRRRTTIAVFKK